MEAEKPFTKEDDKGPRELVIRCRQSTFLTKSYTNKGERNETFFESGTEAGSCCFLLQTRDGARVISGSEHQINIMCRKRGICEWRAEFNYIYSLSLSPNERYLQVLDKKDSNQGITFLFDLTALGTEKGHIPAARFREDSHSNYYNKSAYPLVRFTADDLTYFRYSTKTLEVYVDHTLTRQIPLLHPANSFEVSRNSTKDNYFLASVYLDKKSAEGWIQLYNHQNPEPLYSKQIKKAEEIKIKFSPTNNSFLLELQTYHDPTGKSYYGEFGLFLFSHQTNKIAKVRLEEGPVHDFCWHPNGINYLVTAGFIPATTALFDAARQGPTNESILTLGKHHRNTIVWGNLGRFVLIAGFGNLGGGIDIWDIEERKLIASCKSNSASYCAWAPDDRKFLSAIITPRLRVDNSVKIFAYTGTLLQKIDFSSTELYDAQWLKGGQWECRGVTPGRKTETLEAEGAKFKSFAGGFNLEQ